MHRDEAKSSREGAGATVEAISLHLSGSNRPHHAVAGLESGCSQFSKLGPRHPRLLFVSSCHALSKLAIDSGWLVGLICSRILLRSPRQTLFPSPTMGIFDRILCDSQPCTRALCDCRTDIRYILASQTSARFGKLSSSPV